MSEQGFFIERILSCQRNSIVKNNYEIASVAQVFLTTVTKLVEETKKIVKGVEQSASKAGKAVSKKVGQAVEATKEQAQKVANSVEDFAANLGGLPLDRAKTFYDEGIKSASDFKNWTEKELLALKGIGPATIKKLKENGIKFK